MNLDFTRLCECFAPAKFELAIITICVYNSNEQYAWGAYKYNISHPFIHGDQAITEYIANVHKRHESKTYADVDIDDLLDAYESNINTAVQQYEGKFVKISYAHVSDIGTDSIEFKGNGDSIFSYVVSRNINHHDKQVLSDIYKVKTEDYVTIYGRIIGTYRRASGTDVSILIDHIVPTPVTAQQLIQRAANRTMQKLQQQK